MKNVSRIMYKIGKIFNWIEIGLSIFMLVLGIVSIACAPDIAAQATSEDLNTPEKVRAAGVTLVVAFTLVLAVSIVVLCLAKRAIKSLANNDKNSTPHIIMIVIGVFGDIFYLLGGVFGIFSQSLAANNTTNEE